MLDRHEAHDNRNESGQNLHRDAAADRPHADRPMADREVPLPGLAATNDPSTVAIHQWLDGDLAETEARRADDKQVDLWNRISVETDQRRRMVTPAYVAANIMNAIPEKQTATRTEARFTTHADAAAGVSMKMAVAIGGAMLAVGYLFGNMF